MRFLLIVSVMMTMMIPFATVQSAPDHENQKTMILEVEGDPAERAKIIVSHHPYIEVVDVYDLLLQAVAVKGPQEKMARIASHDFIKTIHPVTTYNHPHGDLAASQAELPVKASLPGPVSEQDALINPQVIPGDLNTTPFTGKGVKVGVIDTGIDFNHPDLADNYKGGYDLVDLDDEPMETQVSEGIPTIHGTHVAGIIAGDGALKGVAPDAELYAYRALGPGGQGTSVQVIAALEEAVRDGMDVVNLSLGNAINGPDYPTSQAVNRATEKGTMIVIANGNDGPGDWTVGSPATAVNALSVGATAPKTMMPELYVPVLDQDIALQPMRGSVPWALSKDFPFAELTDPSRNVTDHIVLTKRGQTPFYELAQEAEAKGAKALLVMNKEDGSFQGSVAGEKPISIPAAGISKKAGEALIKAMADRDHLYLETVYSTTEKHMAAFSSRGPVTVSWNIKPEISAPGANIWSTVPGGYKELQGTSMAAPHVAGALAVLKEAHPDWSNKKLTNALTTTANPLADPTGKRLTPIEQGAGDIQLDQARTTDTIIHEGFLTYGKFADYSQKETIDLTIENVSDESLTYTFVMPKKEAGVVWDLPKTFTVPPHETATISIGMTVTSMRQDSGLHQGYLQLKEGSETFHIPYLYMNQTADYPKAMGIGVTLKPFSADAYTYQYYMTEDVKDLKIDLYNPHTLIHERVLLEDRDVKQGLNKGEMNKKEIGPPGEYKGMIIMELADGTIETIETDIFIPPSH
ncbi:Minor extracellular protease vpr [Lentibacillus sp. JNUCC-1]|uniref:S8 family serine peptidase n=1 Tax=Lentibacillus sp. JNUCC-1 TaxID=2654513 RepID=UPI0012E8CFED|nr:S8 family serine peptidase [Lentibacillus sp. JNUCC-1]MUV37390.1 Minor extracellular protease vpr [Lentibacillus sp. JNUCC-1]